MMLLVIDTNLKQISMFHTVILSILCREKEPESHTFYLLNDFTNVAAIHNFVWFPLDVLF